MAERVGGTAEVLVETTTCPRETEEVPTLVLQLNKPKTDKQVKWDEKVVDNEFMGKKSSKCCCIYTAPKTFGVSSSESDSDDCCHELKSARKQKKKKKQPKEQQASQPDCKCDH